MTKVINVDKFRKSFQWVSKDLTRYFPGHMNKGMRKVQNKLKNVDLIVEVHDARIPISGRNPNFRQIIDVKPHILIMNKMDLTDLTHKEKIVSLLQEQGIDIVEYTNCKNQGDHVVKNVILRNAIDLINSMPRFNRSGIEEYNIMIIGIPNVGKSSLINALRSTHLKKGKATQVGALAGVTRSVLERIRINYNPSVFVIDSPGILEPSVNDVEKGMKLAICSNLKDDLVGYVNIVDYLLFWLNKRRHFSYIDFFNLPGSTDDVYELLAWICKENEWVLKQRSPDGVGYRTYPNFDRAAHFVINTFRKGELGKFLLDEDFLEET